MSRAPSGSPMGRRFYPLLGLFPKRSCSGSRQPNIDARCAVGNMGILPPLPLSRASDSCWVFIRSGYFSTPRRQGKKQARDLNLQQMLRKPIRTENPRVGG